MTAKNNFWGAATGAGAEPADDICTTVGPIDAIPFATTAFKVKVSAGR